VLSPCEWYDSFLDQGLQVRRGEAKNGAWHVEVAQDGDYEFTLRRWPVEADAAISAGVPEATLTDGKLPAGKALPIASARLRIREVDERCPVKSDDRSVTFRVKLRAGDTQLQTWFLDAEGRELCGAYYVTVLRKKAA